MTKYFILSLVIAVLSGYSASTHGEQSPDWYPDSWVHSHVSISPSASELGAISKQIELAGLDAVQFHTYRLDLWDAIRKAGVDKRLEFKMVATMNWSGTWYPYYDKDPTYVYRVHPDGTFAGRWTKKHLCLNAPVVRERVIPQRYKVLTGRLKPDQVWIDENVITVNLCWCEHCTRLYRKQASENPPTTLTGDNHDQWTRWTTFHRKSFERWMDDVTSAVSESAPEALLTFNHAWFVEQPETPPSYIKNLSADIHNNPLKLGLYARYGGSGPLPFDLMPGLGSDFWAGVRPKQVDQVLNDVALTVAHGGRWNIGEYPTNQGSVNKRAKANGVDRRPLERYMELAEIGSRFARERQSFCQDTKPVPYVALLHGAATHYDHVVRSFNGLTTADGFAETSDGDFQRVDPGKVNSRVYWPDNKPIADSIVGAYQALIENHIHFNFTIEDRLEADLEHAVLLILPEQHRLSKRAIGVIKRYVRGGGRVLATGSTRHAGLDQIFDYSSQKPKSVGKGQTLYFTDDFFLRYAKTSGYAHRPKGGGEAMRVQAAKLFESLLPDSEYILDAQPWFEWTIRESDDEQHLLVHLINRRVNWKLPRGDEAAPIQIGLALPKAPRAVTLEPGGEAVAWRYEQGVLSAEIDPESVRHHRIMRIVR